MLYRTDVAILLVSNRASDGCYSAVHVCYTMFGINIPDLELVAILLRRMLAEYVIFRLLNLYDSARACFGVWFAHAYMALVPLNLREHRSMLHFSAP